MFTYFVVAAAVGSTALFALLALRAWVQVRTALGYLRHSSSTAA